MTVVIYGNNIKAPLARWCYRARCGHGFGPLECGHVAHKIAGNQFQVSLFGKIDGGLGWLHVARGPRLHLDEAQNFLVPAHQVQFATVMRRSVVAGDDRISAAPQIKVGVLFAAPARPLVRWDIVRWKESARDPIQAAQHRMRETARKHGYSLRTTLRSAVARRCARSHMSFGHRVSWLFQPSAPASA